MVLKDGESLKFWNVASASQVAMHRSGDNLRFDRSEATLIRVSCVLKSDAVRQGRLQSPRLIRVSSPDELAGRFQVVIRATLASNCSASPPASRRRLSDQNDTLHSLPSLAEDIGRVGQVAVF
jgi:hypothetical protein